MIIWLMGLVIEPIIYLVVWRTVTVSEGGSVAGFTAGNFAAYYIAMMIINHLTFTWIMWEYEYYIRNGTLAAMLLRPIHPIHKDVSSNIAYKLLTSAVLLPIVLALIWLFQPTAEITIGTTLAFIPALLLAAAMRFMTGWTLALAAFWTTRISAINSAYFAAIYFFSGRMAPLELFPNFVQIIAYGLPFRWMLAFPVDLLLGKLTLPIHTQCGLADGRASIFGGGQLNCGDKRPLCEQLSIINYQLLMRDYINLIYTFFRLGILNELQYRANFFIQLLQTALQLTISIGGLAVVFQHTDNLAGWQAMELVALLGIYFVMRGAIYTVISPSLELFMQDVIAILTFALARLGTTIGMTHLLGFGITLLCGGVIVYSFWMMLATCAFWFIKVENILVIFESMYQAGKWPVTIYPQTLRILLTFIVPVAFAVTVPAQALVGQLTLQNMLLSIGVAVMLFTVARLFWRTGIKYYSGASA